MIRTLLFTFITGMILAFPAIGNAGDPVVKYNRTDPAMKHAIQNALGSLDLFLKAMDTGNGNFHPDSSLKVSFEVNTGETDNEIIWVDHLRREKNGRFLGRLANEPNFMDGLELGSNVQFSAAQIRDWGYYGEDQKLYGHYTTRVLVQRLPKEQAASILSILSNPIVPTAWK